METEIIVERAIVEADFEAATVNGGKRERPPSAASSAGENQARPTFDLVT